MKTITGKSSSFAARLIALRSAAGLTRYALAKASGVSQGQLAHLEAGRRGPNWQTVCKLADALGVSVQAFRG